MPTSRLARGWWVLAIALGCSRPSGTTGGSASAADSSSRAAEASDHWDLGPPLEGLPEFSGLTRVGDDLYIAMNRIWHDPRAQVFRVSPGPDDAYSCTGMWSVQGPDDPWVDAEAITPTERGTFLLLVERTDGDDAARIWELSLPEPAPTPTPAQILHRWRLPPRYVDDGGGSEALVLVPPPADLPGPAGAQWVLVGHQTHDYIGLFALVDDEADRDAPIEPVRELANGFSDTSDMTYEPGALYLWHNEDIPTPHCRDAAPRVNVLERFAWDRAHTPTDLREPVATWKYPQTDDAACYNFEGIALGPCQDDGRRMLFLVNDDGVPHSASRRLIEGFCP